MLLYLIIAALLLSNTLLLLFWWKNKRQSNLHIMSILSRHMPEPVLITNNKGRIVAYSPSACELFGYKPDEIFNMSVEKLMPKEFSHRHRKLREGFMVKHSGKAMDNEILCLNKSGDKISAITRVRTFLLGNDHFAFVSILDLREFKNREAALKNLSEHDPLTGLANRRLFDHDLKREWNRALRNNQTLTLMMIDIDYFKQFNDFYGHPLGDTCLTKLAQIMLKENYRSTDCIARYGGEEFIGLFPLLNAEDAKKKAEAVRQAIESAQIPHKPSQISQWVTASIGVATMVPSIDQDPNELIESADAALYQAKADGRNCIRQTLANTSKF